MTSLVAKFETSLSSKEQLDWFKLLWYGKIKLKLLISEPIMANYKLIEKISAIKINSTYATVCVGLVTVTTWSLLEHSKRDSLGLGV